MKVLIVDTYYENFLKNFYSKHNLKDCSYKEIHCSLMDELFGTSDYYSSNLQKLGVEAKDIIYNDSVLQKKWAQEKHISTKNPFWVFDKKKRKKNEEEISFKIFMNQVDEFNPDFLYIHNITLFSHKQLQLFKQKKIKIIGQNACPITNFNYSLYDTILTACPHYVKKFQNFGIKAYYFKIAFGTKVLKKVTPQKRKYECTFVGGFSPYHNNCNMLLESISDIPEMKYFGYGKDHLDANSKILPKHYGEIWGKEMYKILLQSKITINRHGAVAQNYACNMRLYEATGCGALLITDHKDNIDKLFEVDKEIVSYKTAHELKEKINYYINNPEKAKTIAKAGQQRTLQEHTYLNRMKELVKILEKL